MCGYSVLSNGVCNEVTSTIDDCVLYESQTKCAACELEYQLSAGTCVEIKTPEDCISKDADGNCVACDDDKVYDVTAKECTDKDCKELTGCDKHACFDTTTSVCLKCKDDYALTATGTCTATDVSNCRVAGDTKSKCAQCDFEYYDVNQTECKSSSL